MKKTTLTLVVLLGIILLTGCRHNSNKITFNGIAPENGPAKMYLSIMLPGEEKIVDSAKVKGERFYLSYKPEKSENTTPYFFTIHAGNERVATIGSKGEEINITLNQRNFSQHYSVSGAMDATLMHQLDSTLTAFADSVTVLEQYFQPNRYDDSLKVWIETQYMSLVQTHQRYLLQFIENNPQSLATIPAFYQRFGRRIFISEEDNSDILEKMVQNLKQKYPTSKDVLFIEKRWNELETRNKE